MTDLFATISTNEMCVTLTEIGIPIPVRHRNIVKKLVHEAIRNGKLELVDSKLRAITPLRRRMSKSNYTLQELMCCSTNELVARKVNTDSPRLMCE